MDRLAQCCSGNSRREQMQGLRHRHLLLSLLSRGEVLARAASHSQATLVHRRSVRRWGQDEGCI